MKAPKLSRGIFLTLGLMIAAVALAGTPNKGVPTTAVPLRNTGPVPVATPAPVPVSVPEPAPVATPTPAPVSNPAPRRPLKILAGRPVLVSIPDLYSSTSCCPSCDRSVQLMAAGSVFHIQPTKTEAFGQKEN